MTDGEILAIAREVGWNTEHKASNDYLVRFARALMDKQRAWFTASELNEWATKLPLTTYWERREDGKIGPTNQLPKTTHWEGCEAVHPECKEKNT